MIAFTPLTVNGAPQFQWRWMTSTGQAQVNALGAANPIVRDGILSELELYISSFEGAVALTPGTVCPAVGGIDCNNRGECNCKTGTCTCPADDVCLNGPTCGNTCNLGGVSTGVCTATGNTTFACACDGCHSGPTCGTYTCGGSAPFLSTPAGAAAVAVPVTLVLVAALGLGVWRAMHPGAPWSDLLPGGVKGRMGMAGAPLIDENAPLKGFKSGNV